MNENDYLDIKRRINDWIADRLCNEFLIETSNKKAIELWEFYNSAKVFYPAIASLIEETIVKYKNFDPEQLENFLKLPLEWPPNIEEFFWDELTKNIFVEEELISTLNIFDVKMRSKNCEMILKKNLSRLDCPHLIWLKIYHENLYSKYLMDIIALNVIRTANPDEFVFLFTDKNSDIDPMLLSQIEISPNQLAQLLIIRDLSENPLIFKTAMLVLAKIRATLNKPLSQYIKIPSS